MKTLRIILAASLVAAAPLRAQIVNDGATRTLINETNSLTGNVIVGTNGSFTLLVLADNALLTNSVDGVIGLNATAKSNEVRLISATAHWLVGSYLHVGSNGSFNRLVVSNGAIVRDSFGSLDFSSTSSNNLAVVTGPGSVWSTEFDLLIGRSGPGNQLIVNNGGVVSDEAGYLGFNSTSASNLAVIAGSGSIWSNTDSLLVGRAAAGNRLVVSNGAAVVILNNGIVGTSISASNNSVAVSGAGTVWSNQNSLQVGNFGSANRFELSDGAVAYAGGDGVLGVIANANSNSVLVTDPGTSWLVATNLYVGSNGAANLLIVSNGGFVQNGYGFDQFLGYASSSSNNLAVVTGSGSVWSNSLGTLFVGRAGSGNQLVVSNAGRVDTGVALLSGFAVSSNNLALITGPGSRLRMLNGGIFVGDIGVGNRMVVSNGGSVVNFEGIIGTTTFSSNNEALVTGAGSTWTNQSLDIGYFGSGNRLIITNGGLVFASTSVTVGQYPSSTNNRVVVDGGTLSALRFGAFGLLDVRRGTNVLNAGLIDADQLLMTNALGKFEFNGGTLITRGAVITNGAPFVVGANGNNPAVWDVRGGASNHVLSVELYVGSNSPLNHLFVTNGGSLANTFGYLGWQSGSSSNEATVAGAGSSWSNQFDLLVGRDGRGNQLNVRDGGVVRSEFGFLGFNASSSNNVALVSGAGSMWSNSADLLVGRAGRGNLLVVSNGALVSVSGGAFIGNNSGATNNRAVVDGGTLLVTNATATGLLDVRRGIFTQNSGLVEVDRLLVTNLSSDFKLNGGTLSSKSTTFNSGAFLNVGNNVGPATFLLAGNGTHVFGSLEIDATATLTGNGTVGGPIVALNGSTISPGTSIGKMIFTNSPFLFGTILMEISKTGSVLTNDQIQVTGALTYGGTLTVSNLGPTALVNGDKFQLFNAPSYGGSFTSPTVPPLGPGLTWKTNLLVDGSIEVFAPPAIPISTLSSGSYTQNFDSLSMSGGANLWRDNSTLLGWYAARSNAPVNITSYVASDGSDNAGALYSFGSSGSPERALGSIPSNATGAIGYGLGFTNDTASSVSNFVITYTGEQWRAGGDGANTLTFWYQVSASGLTNPEPGVVTNWIQVTALNFVSPTVLTNGTALDGNQATNRQTFSSVFVSGLVVPPGQTVFFRWRDLDDGGADQGMAVDDLTVAFSPVLPKITSVTSNPTNGFTQLIGLGESNVTYGIEAASNLNSPIFWQRLGSNTANGSGVFQFTDTNAPFFSRRFYRALTP